MARNAASDHHAVLGVPRDAGIAEIKAAYRRLARECHPDPHPGDSDAEVRFKLVFGAYEALRGVRTYDATVGATSGATSSATAVAPHFDPALAVDPTPWTGRRPGEG